MTCVTLELKSQEKKEIEYEQQKKKSYGRYSFQHYI